MRDGWSSGMYRFLHYTDDAVLYVKTKFEEISLQVQVLGALCGRGVPMLLNKRGRVWLYNVPHAIDRPLRNFKHRLAMVLRAGEEGSVDKKLVLHDSVEFKLVDPYLTRFEFRVTLYSFSVAKKFTEYYLFNYH